MFSFLKRSKSGVQVPEWADFFSDVEYEKFITLIGKFFAKEKIAFRLDDGFVDVSTERYGATQLGLVNLAQGCKQAPSYAWKKRISNHFQQMERIMLFDKEFSAKSKDFNNVKEVLGVRIYHIDYIMNLEDGAAITKIITEDIIAVLVFDFPHSVRTVGLQEIEPWNLSQEELFRIGIDNISRNYQLDLTKRKIGDIQCWCAEEEHFYSPNIILDIKRFPQAIGAYGALVAIPTRHIVLSYPIEDLDVLTACNTLVPVISEINNQGPGSISDGLFWYFNDAFTPIPYTLDENELQVTPPDGFVQMLNELQPGKLSSSSENQ